MSIDTRSTTQNAASRRRGKQPASEPYCGLCNRRFPNAGALAMHEQTSKAHQTIDRTSPTAAAFASMMTAHQPADGFGCSICARSFPTQKALDMHIENSTQHKRYAKNSGHGTRRPPPKRPTDTVRQPQTGRSAGNNNLEVTRKREPGGKSDVSKSETRHRRAGVTSPVGYQIHQGAMAVRNMTVKDKGHLPSSPNAAIMSYAYVESVQPAAKQVTGSILFAGHVDKQVSLVSPIIPATREGLHKAAIPDLSQPSPGQRWSQLPVFSQGVMLGELGKNCHTREDLLRQGYRVHQPTPDEIDASRKCRNCEVKKRIIDSKSVSECRFHPRPRHFRSSVIHHATKAENCFPIVCFPKCCDGKGKGGCCILRHHDYPPADHRLRQLTVTPAHRPSGLAKRAAVVLDCEMVGVIGGRSELVRLSAVDFLTGQILLDIFVIPADRIIAWRTKKSGVTLDILRSMKVQGRTVDGWQAARALLWTYIDANTILIGHSLNNDLSVLGMIHTRVVDSVILTRNAVGPDCHRSWALKTLCEQFLNRQIQNAASGHDCIEDTFATREVVLWCLQHPDRLSNWAFLERELIEKKRLEAEEEKRKKEEARKALEEKLKLKLKRNTDDDDTTASPAVEEEEIDMTYLSDGSDDSDSSLVEKFVSWRGVRGRF